MHRQGPLAGPNALEPCDDAAVHPLERSKNTLPTEESRCTSRAKRIDAMKQRRRPIQ
jgi:hypothetical protein